MSLPTLRFTMGRLEEGHDPIMHFPGGTGPHGACGYHARITLYPRADRAAFCAESRVNSWSSEPSLAFDRASRQPFAGAGVHRTARKWVGYWLGGSLAWPAEGGRSRAAGMP
jgi:hypothetical protein